MNRKINRLNNISKEFLETSGRKVVAARVFTNCLCLYFDRGGCRFYSKKGFNWGNVGQIYFTTYKYDRASISKKLWSEFGNLIKWFEEYSNAPNYNKIGLLLEYTIKYA